MSLLLSRSFVVTAVVAVMCFSVLLRSSNWVIMAPYYQGTEQYGFLLTLAEVMGLHYGHASMPEYYKNIGPGNSWSSQKLGSVLFFAGLFSIVANVVWWYLGKIFIAVQKKYLIS
jgi:methane/ammonia monooxygenase subunit A